MTNDGGPLHVASDRTAVISLVRHGRTSLNAAGVLRGRLDPGLDEVGRSEANALGNMFTRVDLAAVVASPLRRAVETARRIAEASGAAVIIDEDVVDRDFGRWTGQPILEVVARFGSLDDAPCVEPASAFSTRVARRGAALADESTLRPVAIVARDAVIRYALTALVPSLGPPDAIPQRTGCWSRLERAGSQWLAPVIDALPRDVDSRVNPGGRHE